MTESEIYKIPAGESWTMDDERIRERRLALAEVESRMAEARDRLNDAIRQRRATLATDHTVVCPICGRVLGTQATFLEPHRGLRGQCRGAGLTRAEAAMIWDGGL